MKKYLPFSFCMAVLCLLSCQNRTNSESAPLNDSTSYTGLTGSNVKLVKTATIEFKVKNVEQSIRTVSELAVTYGGMLYEQHYQSPEADKKEWRITDDSLLVITATKPQASLTVRVPSENLEAFLYGVSDIGYFTGDRHLKIDDKSLLYLENKLRQQNKAAGLPATTTAKNIESRTHVKDEIITESIANKSIEAEAAYSLVNLSLSQNILVNRERVANHDLTAYELSFAQRLKNATGSGWQGFLTILLALTHLWVFILIGFLSWLVYKTYWRQRKVIG